MALSHASSRLFFQCSRAKTPKFCRFHLIQVDLLLHEVAWFKHTFLMAHMDAHLSRCSPTCRTRTMWCPPIYISWFTKPLSIDISLIYLPQVLLVGVISQVSYGAAPWINHQGSRKVNAFSLSCLTSCSCASRSHGGADNWVQMGPKTMGDAWEPTWTNHSMGNYGEMCGINNDKYIPNNMIFGEY